MKDRQIIIVLAVIVAILLVTNFASLGKAGQSKSEAAKLNQLIKQKETEAKTLIGQIQAKQNELDGVKKELADANAKLLAAQKQLSGVKQDIDSVSKKIEVPKTKPAAPKK